MCEGSRAAGALLALLVHFPHHAHRELAEAIDRLLNAMAHENDRETAKR